MDDLRSASRTALRAVLALACCAPVAAQGLPAADVLPEALRPEIRAIVRVEDPRWLVQRSDAIAQTMGRQGDQLRRRVAEFFFNAASPDGLDLGRPVVLAWREGAAPLLAVLPLRDRRSFFEGFGQVRFYDRLLLRVDEREGTIVYSQSSPTGIWDYRMVVAEQWACLGRDAAEARALVAAPPVRADGGPAVVIEFDGAFLPQVLDGPLVELIDGMKAGAATHRPQLAALLGGRLRKILDQVARVRVELGEDERGMLRISLQVSADADTALAAWIGRQSNAGSRLLPLVSRPGDVCDLYGAVAWQGEIEALGRDLVLALREEGRQVTVEQAQDLRNYFRLLDRMGAFAWSFVMENATAFLSREIWEQPQAAELLTLERAVDAILTDKPGELDAIGGLAAYRIEHPAGEDAGSYTTISAASLDRLLCVESDSADRAQLESRTLAAAIAETHPPDTEPAVVALRVHVGEILRRVVAATGRGHAPAQDLTVTLLAHANAGRLHCDLRLPLQELLELVGRSSVGLDAERQPAPPRR